MTTPNSPGLVVCKVSRYYHKGSERLIYCEGCPCLVAHVSSASCHDLCEGGDHECVPVSDAGKEEEEP